jgi:hypothetical protein
MVRWEGNKIQGPRKYSSVFKKAPDMLLWRADCAILLTGYLWIRVPVKKQDVGRPHTAAVHLLMPRYLMCPSEEGW